MSNFVLFWGQIFIYMSKFMLFWGPPSTCRYSYHLVTPFKSKKKCLDQKELLRRKSTRTKKMPREEISWCERVCVTRSVHVTTCRCFASICACIICIYNQNTRRIFQKTDRREEAWQSAHVLYLTSAHHGQFGFTQSSSSLQLIDCAMHTYGWQLYIYYKFSHEVAIILKAINYEMLIIRMCHLFWIKRERERGSLMTTKKTDLVAGPLRLYTYCNI